MTTYLDKIGRRVQVQSSASGKFYAWVRLKDGVNWKIFHPREIPGNRDASVVADSLYNYACEHGMAKA